MLISIIFSSLLSVIAIIVSILALRESRFANKLNIEPFITIHCPFTFTGTELPLTIKNRGKVDVEDLIIVWVTTQTDSSGKHSKILSGSHPIAKTFKTTDEKSHKLSLEEQIEKKRKDQKGNIINLGIKSVYRRSSDAKAGENIFYFMLSLHDFGISVSDITSWRGVGFLKTKKELNKFFYR